MKLWNLDKKVLIVILVSLLLIGIAAAVTINYLNADMTASVTVNFYNATTNCSVWKCI